MELHGLVMGGIALLSGLPMLLHPRRKREATEAKISARRSELEAGASQQYFEERRTLDAYPPPKSDGGWRVRGAVLTLTGMLLVMLSFYR